MSKSPKFKKFHALRQALYALESAKRYAEISELVDGAEGRRPDPKRYASALLGVPKALDRALRASGGTPTDFEPRLRAFEAAARAEVLSKTNAAVAKMALSLATPPDEFNGYDDDTMDDIESLAAEIAGAVEELKYVNDNAGARV